jgi:CRISPR system Cascade subunit CasB
MKSEIDFVRIKTTFEAMKSGPKADIRRASLPEDLVLHGAFYRLLPEGAPPTPQWQRVIFMLPWAGHHPQAPSLGQRLAQGEKKISEQRLFQLLRSEFPLDILHLRRLLRFSNPTLNWQFFGETLLYWGESQKRNIAKDYFLSHSKSSS